MNRPLKNTSASIHARLANQARLLGRPFGEVLQEYGMERFLYRLSRTQFSDDLILKGGLIFTSWELPLRRPTRDIDLLSFLDNRKGTILEVLKACIESSVPEDGVVFDASTIVIETIQVDADQAGIRATFLGYLGRAEIPMQIDIGFSDELASPAEELHYPTLLKPMDAPVLRGYPPAAVIAEKLHAMQRFAGLPSRWKDYYDIWLVSQHFSFDDRSLQEAIARTFENRSTPVPAGRPHSLAAEFAAQHNVAWVTFLKKYRLENTEINDLAWVVDKIWNFIEWPLKGLSARGAQQDHRRWEPGRRKWRRA